LTRLAGLTMPYQLRCWFWGAACKVDFPGCVRSKAHAGKQRRRAMLRFLQRPVNAAVLRFRKVSIWWRACLRYTNPVLVFNGRADRHHAEPGPCTSA
jgi:hypothetical protein